MFTCPPGILVRTQVENHWYKPFSTHWPGDGLKASLSPRPGLTRSGSCPPFRPLSCWAGPSCAPGSMPQPLPSLSPQGCSLSAARPLRPFGLQLKCLSQRGPPRPHLPWTPLPPRHCPHHCPACSLCISCQASRLPCLLPKYCLIGHL